MKSARPAGGARLSSRRSQRAVDHYLVDGLENAPAAFIGLLEGRNFGKLVVRVADP
jgi:NADPH-dependent curcumin reductase CurA